MKSLLHFCKFLLHRELPQTQLTAREVELLLKYSCDVAIAVEIGCYEGSTTAALASNTKGAIFSIDPFFNGRAGVCYGEWIAKLHCQRRKLNNVHFIKGFSFEVVHKFHNEIDFLFIDADHSYEAIKRDWNDWFPKMRRHGIIALHDCKQAINSPHYLGSMRFYDEDIPEITNIEQLDSVDSLVLFKALK